MGDLRDDEAENGDFRGAVVVFHEVGVVAPKAVVGSPGLGIWVRGGWTREID